MANHDEQIILIKKSSGETEPFSVTKLIGSLRKAGAEEEVIQHVSADIKSWIYEGVTTQKIYNKAFGLLKRKRNHHIASRYKLKEALMELGPTGYPFERFIAEVMRTKGYSTLVGQTLPGMCVTHEVDVVATKENEQCFVECKYGTNNDRQVNVKVPLYIRSRVNDLIAKRKESDEYKDFTFNGWLVTNTRFTSDATAYGVCSGLKLLSWDYPEGDALKDIIDREKIYPITVLNQLSKAQKQTLLAKDVVTCRQLLREPQVLSVLELNQNKQNAIIRELHKLLHEA